MTPEQHRRVLVVDDDPEIRALLGAVLRQRSLIVDEASDGREAIALLHENAYSVVLLDLLMPVLDGFTVLDSMSDGLAVQPIVLVITGADRAHMQALDSRRIHGILRKPLIAQEVADVVEACVDIRGRSAFETMALTTMITSAPILALLSSSKW